MSDINTYPVACGGYLVVLERGLDIMGSPMNIDQREDPAVIRAVLLNTLIFEVSM